MSDKKTVIGDKMINAQLKEYSNKLNISVDDLINQYIRRGVYRDLYYEQCNISKEKLQEIFKLDNTSPKPKRIQKENSMDTLIDIYISDI